MTLLALASAGCGTGRASQWEAKPPAAGAPGPSTARPAIAPGRVPGPGTPESLLASAETGWASRAERRSLDATIAAWEQVVSLRPEDADTLARVARAHHLLADGFLRAPASKDAYLATLEKGVAAGERAMAAASPAFRAKVVAGAQPQDAVPLVGREGLEAMYWYAVNLGKWSRAKGVAALLGNKDRVKGVMTRVLELDPQFFHGAPHRYFGAYYALLPVGRDLDKSREHFDKSVAIAPYYAGTKVLMAETYAAKKQDRALFDRLLAEVAALPEGAIPGLEPETRIEKEKAQELKAKADELF